VGRKTLAEMVGELLREGGILLLVFGLLDPFLRGGAPGLPWVGWVVGLSLLAIGAGCRIEVRRHHGP
jgi:hypothetical protein